MIEGFSLAGKKAMVAGYIHPWGRVIALALAEAGAEVALACPASEEPESVVAEIIRSGGKALALPTRVDRAADIGRAVKRAVARLGRIDILANCFDIALGKAAVATTNREWERVIHLNLTCQFLWCREVGKYMLQQKEGRIINLSSGLGVRGLAHASAYCASMGGVLQLTQALALEWAKEGVRVNAIAPCWFEGAGLAQAAPRERLAHFIPLRRLGQPEEIGALAVYLASAADYITGHTYYLSGGVLSHA